MIDGISPTPWDTAVFDIPCYEITQANAQTLAYAASAPGHYTVKVEPLMNKRLLQQYGFYYTDTLLQPLCPDSRFIDHPHTEAAVDTGVALEDVLPVCRQAFTYDRFHRDFLLSKELADQRYVSWLEQLYREDEVLGLMYEGKLAGFIACANQCFVLHALAEGFRGRGLGKYLWSAACRHCFAQGVESIASSVSASNLAVLNLYASLGFRFDHAVDVYHRLNTEGRSTPP